MSEMSASDLLAGDAQRIAAVAALERVSADLQSTLGVLGPVAEADPCYEPLLRAQETHALLPACDLIEAAQHYVDAVLRRLRNGLD